jgi:hypothetical protein
MENKYYRLRRLAEHLSEGKLQNVYNKISTLIVDGRKELIFYDNLYYMIFPWFEIELPQVFLEFSLNHKGISQYLPKPSISVPFVLPLYLNLSTEEYLHCFVIGKHNSVFGSTILTSSSTPQECGAHILNFLSLAEAQAKKEEFALERVVLFEKISLPNRKKQRGDFEKWYGF